MYPNTKETGFLPSPIDFRDVWEDEVLAGEDTLAIPDSYRVEGLEYDQQFFTPYCVAFAVTTAAEKAYELASGGEKFKFSQPHLFHHSGGMPIGSYFRANLDTLVNKGAITYAQMPMKSVTYLAEHKDWFNEDKARALATPFIDAKKILGYARVNPTETELKRSIMRNQGIVAGVYASYLSGYYSGNGKRPKDSRSNHAIYLVGWTEDRWIIFESQGWVAKDEGYGTLHSSYTFDSCYAITSLPEDWRKQRDEARTEPFAHVLNHYDKPRNFVKEQEVAVNVERAFRNFKNQSVYEAYGRFNHVLVNAVCYGGYSLTDVVNSIYSWRRGLGLIFDYNKHRSEFNK